MSSAFAQRLNRFHQELDRELPLPPRLEAEYRRLTGSAATTSSHQQRRSEDRATNVDQARASAAAVVVISDSEAEYDDRPPDDSGFASAAWERTCLEKPRPAALDSVAARPEWQARLSTGHRHATNLSTPSASRAQGPDAESQPPPTTWQPLDAGDEQQPPSLGLGPSTSSPSRLARSSASEPGSAHLEPNSVPGPVISAAQEVARRREATKTAVLNSTARRHPFALGSGYEDISDTSLAATGSGSRMAMGSRPDGDGQQDAAGEATRALMPRRRVAAAAPAPAVTPPRFRTDFADLTALTTPGAGEDPDYSETDDEDGQEQHKRQRRVASPSAPAGDKANRRDQGQHAAAAPRQALALGPKTTTTTTAAAGQAAAPMNAAGPSTIAAAPRQSRDLHPSSDPPEAVRMQESMTASESETDDEVAGVSGAAGSKVTNGGNARPRARNTTFSSSTAAPPLPQKRPASAFNSGPRQPRGSAATAAMSSLAAPSSSTSAGSSSLAADFAREQSALSTRKTLACTAQVDRLREREKRVGSRERGLARAQGGQQQQQQQQQVGPSTPVVGRGGHDAARTDTSAAASRPPPPNSNNSAILDGSTSRASARGLPPPSGPALTTTKSRKKIPDKMPPWPGYAACVRQWSRWMDDEHRINPQQKAGPEGQTFAGLRILLVASPGLEAAAAADDAGESDSEEEERTGRGSRNGGWSKDMEQWVRRVWDNGGRCVRKYVEGETTHLVAIGVKKQQVPDARTCVEVMALDPMEGLAALRGVKKVTLDWARESIRQGRVLDEDDPRWKLV